MLSVSPKIVNNHLSIVNRKCLPDTTGVNEFCSVCDDLFHSPHHNRPAPLEATTKTTNEHEQTQFALNHEEITADFAKAMKGARCRAIYLLQQAGLAGIMFLIALVGARTDGKLI